jgi:THO complex subunit 3
MITVWETSSMTCIHSIIKMDQPVRSVSFSADGRWLAYASEENYVEVHDVVSGEEPDGVWQGCMRGRRAYVCDL